MTGFGALIVMVPLLLLFMDAGVAIPLSVLCGVALQGSGVCIYRSHVNMRAILPLLLGSLPGAWLGSYVLFRLPEAQLRTGLGVFLVLYACWGLFGGLPQPARPPASVWAYAAGFLSGAMGGAFGVTGPPAVVYATRTDWPPDTIRGRLNAFFALLFAVIAVAQFFQGLFVREVWLSAMYAIPACLLGSLCGRRITAGIAPRQYMRLLFLLILVMGASLCRPALRLLFF
jgi:uncharacterized membrane protein YfcA